MRWAYLALRQGRRRRRRPRKRRRQRKKRRRRHKRCHIFSYLIAVPFSFTVLRFCAPMVVGTSRRACSSRGLPLLCCGEKREEGKLRIGGKGQGGDWFSPRRRSAGQVYIKKNASRSIAYISHMIDLDSPRYRKVNFLQEALGFKREKGGG